YVANCRKIQVVGRASNINAIAGLAKVHGPSKKNFATYFGRGELQLDRSILSLSF
ncbi:MAG: hypothetical protein ACI9A8_002417, partial [Cryomorphaceae bacterium]